MDGKQVWKRRVSEHNWQRYFRPFLCGIMDLKIQRSTKEETKDAQTLKLASHADVLRVWDVSYQFLLFVFLLCETVACPVHTYNDGSTIYCQACPENSCNGLTGSSSISDCKCFKGYGGRPESGNPCTGEKEPFNFWPSPHVMFRMFLKTSTRNACFRIRSPERRFLKTPASRFFSLALDRWDRGY